MQTNRLKRVEIHPSGGSIEFLSYDEDGIEYWRLTFTNGSRKALVRLQIPIETIHKELNATIAFLVKSQGIEGLILCLYRLALKGGRPIVLSGFDEPSECDKNI